MVIVDELTPVQKATLTDFVRYHYLTANQVRMLRIWKDNRTMQKEAGNVLRFLTKKGYLLDLELISIRTFGHGSYPIIYTLTASGKAYLETRDVSVPRRIARTSEERKKDPYKLLHTLDVNEVLIRAQLLAQVYPQTFRLQTMIHERDMRSLFKSFGFEQKGIPDGFVLMEVKEPRHWQPQPFVLEYQRSMGKFEESFRQKVQKYLDFLPFLPIVFGVEKAPVVFVTADINDVKNMYAWAEDELEQLHQEDKADLFYFHLFTKQVSSFDLFCKKQWHRPFSQEWYSLYTDYVLQ